MKPEPKCEVQDKPIEDMLMISDIEESDVKSSAKDEFVRAPKTRKLRKLESDEEIKDETAMQPIDKEMSEANNELELTEISKCGPPAPGKKWV